MTEPGLPVPIEEQEDTFLRNIVLLFFRPRAFFEGITSPKKKGWLIIFALSCGLAGAIARAGNARAGVADLARTWAEHWGGVFIVGIIGMFLVYYFGGWLYGRLLRWCGVPQADGNLVRLVYLGASQVAAIPIIISALISTVRFPDPTAAALGTPGWVLWLMLLVAIWSNVVNYIGARTVFKAPKLRGALLFVGLPTALMLLVLASTLLLASAGISFAPRAEISSPREFSGSDMAFSYPGNWRIAKTDPSKNVKAKVEILGRGGAFFNLVHIDSWVKPGNADDLTTLMDRWVEGANKSFTDASAPEPFSEWGTLKGVGRRYEARTKKAVPVPCEIRLFVAPAAGSEILMIIEMFPKAAKAEVEPGFELIRKTFRMTR